MLAGIALLSTGALAGALLASSAGATSSTTIDTCTDSTSSIANNSSIGPGGCLFSANGQYQLVMQTTGNLVLYYLSQADALWNSGTGTGTGASGASATLQSTGNLTVGPATNPYWQSNKKAPDASLVLQDDGNLVVYAINGAGSPYAAWSTNTQDLRGYKLTSDETLEPGQYLKSKDGAWTLSMTFPGYLVLSTTTNPASPYACPTWSEPAVVNYDPQTGANPAITTYDPQSLSFSYTNKVPDWSSSGPGFAPPSGVSNATATAKAYLNMQGDGNLVLYSLPGGGSALWAAGTNPGPSAYAELQTDGNVVVYSSTSVAQWYSGTNDYRGGTLCTDQTLQQGQFLGFASNQPGATLVMQTDCNLVLYEASPAGARTAIWTSATDETQQDGTLPTYFAGCYVRMQSDGNLVMYAPNTFNTTTGAQQVMWQSGTVTKTPPTATGHPFVGPFLLNLYNPYLILQRWGSAPSWKADPENLLPDVETYPTLATAGSYVASGVNEALTNNTFDLQNALEKLGWL